MAQLLLGKPVAGAMYADARHAAKALVASGVTPTLAVFRASESPDALAYERGIARACERACVSVRRETFDENVSQSELARALAAASEGDDAHGIILLTPLPSHVDANALRREISPLKDVDGATAHSLTGVFTGADDCFAPCTAEAAVRMLDFYDIPISGKRVVVVGRSLVVGRPAAMLLLARDATVTICHTRTQNLADVCREADIIVSAAGREGLLGRDCFREGQTVIDCGVSVSPDGGIAGDVVFGEAEGVVDAISPVPGGLGAVTSALLAEHVVKSCARLQTEG